MTHDRSIRLLTQHATVSNPQHSDHTSEQFDSSIPALSSYAEHGANYPFAAKGTTA